MDSIFLCLVLIGSFATTIAKNDDMTLLAKFDRLEARILHQEIKLEIANSEIVSLKKQVQKLESILNSYEQKSRVIAAVDPVPSAVFYPRTCLEARDSGLPEFKESGMYWIDPDGLGIGDGPIYVHCDMTTGLTSIRHDSESTIPIPRCDGPGCYSRSIVYPNVTDRQIKALVDISAECHQSLLVNCLGGPFTIDEENYAWWIDIDGQTQNFWSGSDSSVHICQCGIDGNCVRLDLTCNCDANVAVPLSDNGIISLKEVLPVKELYFGKIRYEGGSHTLGQLECSGKSIAAGDYPKSCQDLWRIGHILNGFYPIRGDKHVEFVHCDFSMGQDVVQNRIGLVNVKSELVQFYVQRKTSFQRTGEDEPIPFEIDIVNNGNAMNSESGVFTAPKTGTYFFDFSAVGLPETGVYNIIFYKNGEKSASALVADNNQFTVSLPSIWHLNMGDTVKLSISTTDGTIYSDNKSGPLTHFTGLLLEEEIFSS